MIELTERDLKIAEELGGLKTAVQGLATGIDTVHAKLTKYCDQNEQQHTAIWRKVDHHSKVINRLMGGFMAIGMLLGVSYKWLRAKLGI